MTGYIEQLYDFLAEVELNNSREWLARNRERYDRLRGAWMSDLDLLIHHMSRWMPSVATQSARSAAYRFYRDTRFSPDKSPLKTYFSAAISPYGRKAARAGYYLQMGNGDNCGIYGGIWCPDSSLLRKLRHAIVDNIEEFTSIIEAPDIAGLYPGWCGDSLKTIPKGWARDHPQAELLRLKEYGKFMPLGREWFATPDWPARVAELFEPLKPLVDFINYSIDEA